MEKAKKEMERLKTKLALNTSKAPELSPEAKRLLQLYAQGLTDWQHPPKTSITNYQQALQIFGPELSNPENLSRSTLYWLLFITSFRGGKDSELEFWLLARQIAPKAVEELLSEPEDKREFLKIIDQALAEPEETPKTLNPTVNYT